MVTRPFPATLYLPDPGFDVMVPALFSSMVKVKVPAPFGTSRPTCTSEVLAGLPSPSTVITSVPFSELIPKGPPTCLKADPANRELAPTPVCGSMRSEEHTSELQSRLHLVCRLLLEKKKQQTTTLVRRS